MCDRRRRAQPSARPVASSHFSPLPSSCFSDLQRKVPNGDGCFWSRSSRGCFIPFCPVLAWWDTSAGSSLGQSWRSSFREPRQVTDREILLRITQRSVGLFVEQMGLCLAFRVHSRRRTSQSDWRTLIRGQFFAAGLQLTREK